MTRPLHPWPEVRLLVSFICLPVRPSRLPFPIKQATRMLSKVNATTNTAKGRRLCNTGT